MKWLSFRSSKSRILEIHDMNDLKKEDLEDLVQLVKETERLDAMENVFLHFSICVCLHTKG